MKRKYTSQRGAILVEAVITISILSLGLLGLAFFREFYISQLQVTRLARASAIAHSMQACEPDGKEWIGRDLGIFSGLDPQASTETAADPANGSYALGADAPPVAGQLFDAVPNTTTAGEGLLNPITTAGVAGEVHAAMNGESGTGTSFEAAAKSQSFVSCGDEVRHGDVEELLDMLETQLRSLFSL